MPTLSLDGATLHYEDTGGPGEPLLLSHGLLWSARMFEAQIAAFRDRYRVVAWDHRGQGRSSDHAGDTVPIELVTADALALMDALGIERAHFAGLSMGGFVGMRLAARHPDRVRSLVLLETTARPEAAANVPKYGQLGWVAKWLGLWPVAGVVMKIMFGSTFLSDPAQKERVARWRAELTGNRRSIVKAVLGVIQREGVLHEIGRIQVPTTVIVGEEDAATPPEEAEEIANIVPGAVLERIPGAGHTSTVEQPERVISAMERHFARVAERAAG